MKKNLLLFAIGGREQCSPEGITAYAVSEAAPQK